MRKTIIVSVLILFVYIFFMHAFADTIASGTCGENTNWFLASDGTLKITGTGEITSSPWNKMDVMRLVLEEGITSICNDAFYDCYLLSGDLIIPNSVTNIGNRSFSECGFSGTLTLGNNLKPIGDSAFSNSGFCGVLIIPDGVTTIGYAAFNNDRFSGSIIIPDSVTTIGGDSFRCCRGFNGIIEIGKGVREIGSCAFDNCTGLTGGLVIPGNVKKIGSGAFAWCTGLNGSLNLSEGLESIGQGAFSNSGLIGAINIPSTVKSIGEDPFPEGITSITVDDNSIFFKEVDNMLIEKDTGVLLTCAKQKTGRLIIPEGVISIANWAFINCTGIVGELAIPEGVEYIGDRAFEGCKLSGNLVFPRSVQRVGSWAFRGCIGVISITVYGYKTLLSSDAFSDHNPDLTMYGYEGSLAEKYASDNGIYFHKFALELNANNGIGNRIILYFRESSCSIPNNLFYRIGYGFCGWNTCADGSGTYYSDGYMFEKPACIELYAQWNKLSKSLWIPRQVERIEDETFFDTNAEFVILPTTCKEVGNLAFANCENLYQIYIQAIDIIIQDNAFSDSPHIVIVTKEGSNAVLFAMEHGIPVFVDE